VGAILPVCCWGSLPIAVITRFINWFHEFGIPVGGVVVNGVIQKDQVGKDAAEFVRNNPDSPSSVFILEPVKLAGCAQFIARAKGQFGENSGCCFTSVWLTKSSGFLHLSWSMITHSSVTRFSQW
jgi:hypothetical protein